MSQDDAASHRFEKSASSSRLVLSLCFVLFFSVTNATMFNVALPDIASDFSLSHSSVSWIITGYSVLYALGSLLYGKLADKYPLKRLITIGLLMFAAASVVGYFADSYPLVLLARFVQSAGASCVPALVMIVPVRFFPRDQRGKVMGIIASTIAFSSGIGPILGGVVAGRYGWNSLFLISLAAPIMLPLIRRSLPQEQVRDGEKVDLLGASLLGVGVTALMLSVTKFNLWWLLVSAVLLTLFFLHSRRAPNPFVQLSLFRISGYANGLSIGFINSFIVYGVFLMSPLMLRGLYHLNASTIGLVLFPAAMLAALLGRVGGRLADTRGSRFTLFIAMIALAVGLLGLSAVTGLSPWIIVLVLPLVNIPFTFLQATIAKVVSTALPKERIGVGMGVYSLVNFLAGAISGSALTKAIEFDWSMYNMTAVADPSTFGTVYMGLAFLTVVNLVWVGMKVERRQSTSIPVTESLR